MNPVEPYNLTVNLIELHNLQVNRLEYCKALGFNLSFTKSFDLIYKDHRVTSWLCNAAGFLVVYMVRLIPSRLCGEGVFWLVIQKEVFANLILPNLVSLLKAVF